MRTSQEERQEKKNPKQGKEPQNANPYKEEVDKLNDKTFETIPY